MEFSMKATFVLTVINIVFLLALFFVYGKNWLSLKSAFTSGLVLFTLIFLIQNITSVYFYLANTPYFVDMVSMHVFILTVLQTCAFCVMNIISWR